jgi:hypothetical protein
MTVENPGPPQSAGTQAIAQGRSSATGEVFAKIGMVLGMLGTLMLVLYLLWVFFMGGMAFLEGWMNR